jgi:putative ABC transport system substrate-binding protein
MSNPVSQSQWEEFKSATHVFRGEPILLDLRRSEDLPNLFDVIARRKIEALAVGNDTVTHANRKHIVNGVSQQKLPAIYATREFVDDGGLMAYAVSYADLYRRTALYVDKILKGAKPGDLPVEQPAKFEFVLNAKTAKALGLTIPPVILARADEVIE